MLANETLWALVNALIRVSLLLLILRLFESRARVRYMANFMLLLSILQGLTVFLEAFLICRPLSAGWDQSIEGACGNQIASYLALESIGLVIDLVILILPLGMIWQSELKTETKMKMIGIFSLGFVYDYQTLFLWLHKILILIVSSSLHVSESERFTMSYQPISHTQKATWLFSPRLVHC